MAFDLPEDLLEETFLASTGPGGQNVNKVATACQLRVDVFGGLEFVFGAFERGHDGILVNFFFGDRIFGEH